LCEDTSTSPNTHVTTTLCYVQLRTARATTHAATHAATHICYNAHTTTRATTHTCYNAHAPRTHTHTHTHTHCTHTLHTYSDTHSHTYLVHEVLWLLPRRHPLLRIKPIRRAVLFVVHFVPLVRRVLLLLQHRDQHLRGGMGEWRSRRI
jgi:hypothetical protein